MARIAVAPVLPSRTALGAFGLTIDAVRFVVVRPVSDTLADTTVALPPRATELALELRVPLVASPETLRVSIVALSGTIPLFTGTSPVLVPTPPPPPEIPVTTYIGPAADSVVILPRSPFILLNDSLRLQAQAFNGGVPVTQFYLAWSTSDPTAAPINSFGVLRAPAARGAVWVRARTPSGATDSVSATFTPAATQLLAFAGGGQIDTIGRLLGLPLEVLARAADGLGVGGVPVHFRALTGGGSVTDSVVVTDGAGHARTTVTLGGLPGGQTFEATAAGLSGSPVSFGVVALPGPPAQLLAVAGLGQLATVATALLTRPAVLLKDAGGNPVAGASVTFSVSAGGGSLTGGTQLTNAAGVATVGSWTLGTIAGPNALTASAPGVTPVVFTATGLAGAAAGIVKVAGDLQSAIVNTILPIAPQVRIVDQFGNPVSGTTVSAVSSGGGSVVNATPVSDSAGIASVGGWRLGTLVGANGVKVGGTGLAGSPITFSATGLVDVPSQLVAFAGDGQSALIGSALSINPAARVSDQYGNAVGGIPVTFSVSLGGGSIGTPATVTTDTAGIARSPTWTLGPLAGLNTLGATATGLPTVTFSANAIASLARTISAQAGDSQSAIVGTVLAAYSVVVRNALGQPVAGVPVSWAVASGGGVITPALDTTDASGTAIAVRKLGTATGTQTATASVGGLAGSPVTFTATALAGVATRLVKQSIDPQTGTVATAVAAPVVKVTDQFGNGVGGVIVSFAATGGGILGATTNTSDPAGLATTGSWTLGPSVGTSIVTATSGTLSAVAFSATSVADAPAQLGFVLEPTRGLAGNTMPPVNVAIEDQFGNRVPTAQNFVTLGLLPGSNSAAKLQRTVGSTAVNGVATFNDFAIDSAGLGNKLAATSGALTGTSSAFDVGGVIAAVKDDRLNPVAAAFSTATGLVYIPGVSNTISVFDPSKGLITPFPILQNPPFGVAVNAALNRVYVTTNTTLPTPVGAVIALDGRDPSAILAMIPLTGEAKGIAVDEATSRIFVAVGGDAQRLTPPTLVVIDGKANAIVGSIPFPDGMAAGVGVAFNPNDPNGGLVYVAIPTVGIAVFDPANFKFLGSISIVGQKGAAGTYGVAMDVRANLLYATNRAENTVSVIDPSTAKEFRRLSVGLAPEGLGLDSNRGTVYVGNSGESTVSFIDGGKLAVVATLIVGPAPKAAAVNPLTGQIYVPTFTDNQVRVVQP